MQLEVSAKHRMVGVPVTPQLMNLFPSARQLSPDLMAIPHTLDVVKMLHWQASTSPRRC